MDKRSSREKESYNKGFDEQRKAYNKKFGHAGYSAGYEADRIQKIIAQIMRQSKNKEVLEIGSTSWESYLDLRNNAPQKLICINISEKELQKGEQKFEEISSSLSNIQNIQFKVMDANHLEFEDETFDIVFGQSILHHLDFDIAITEIYRILKWGGCAYFWSL